MNTPPRPINQKTSYAKHMAFNVAAYGSATLYHCKMEIFQSASSEEGAYFPPSSIELTNLEGITNLRDLCNEIINSNLQMVEDNQKVTRQ